MVCVVIAQYFNSGIQFRKCVIPETACVQLQEKFFVQAQKPAKKKRTRRDVKLQIPFTILTHTSPMLHSFSLRQRFLRPADGVPASCAFTN
jgi:hypothetical protein